MVVSSALRLHHDDFGDFKVTRLNRLPPAVVFYNHKDKRIQLFYTNFNIPSLNNVRVLLVVVVQLHILYT